MAGETIRQLTQYHVGARSDPRENRMTAALVALLSESPHHAARLAEEWLGSRVDSAPVAVRMQRPVGGNVGWVDLELQVGGLQRRTIWVEVKLGHHLSGANQLDKYASRLRTLDRSGGQRLVLLLAPAQRREAFRKFRALNERVDSGEIGPFFVSWQDVYGVLARRAPNKSPAHINWLLREVLGYMESAELKPTALAPRHLDALRHIEEAFAGLESILEHVSGTLKANGWRVAEKPPKLKEDYWEHRYRPTQPGASSSRRTRAVLSWGIEGGDAFAGVYLERNAGGAVRPRLDEDWRVALQMKIVERSDWDEDDGDRDRVWLGRSTSLRELIRTKTVEAQSAELAGFVSETFSELLSARPEPN